MGTTSRWTVVLCAALAGGCGTASDRIDPHDLELRDLLGVAPDTALAWDPAQRAAARDVLAGGLHDEGAAISPVRAGDGRTLDEQIARALAALDRARAADGEDALGVVRAEVAASRLDVAVRRAAGAAAALTGPGAASMEQAAGARAAPVELWLAGAWDATPAWRELPARGLAALASIARDAGHRGGPVVVVPWARLGVIAGYAVPDEQPPRLLVNPVLLASLEPAGPAELGEAAAMPRAAGVAETTGAEPAAAARAGSVPRPELAPGAAASTAGNPYSFYGSIAECAYAQRTRCESCLGSGTCTPITDSSDGNDECTQLAANDGRGYYLLCINLGLAISSVDACTEDAAPGCPRDDDAAGTLAELESNARFLDDAVCGGALDGCLAEIYGPPPEDFPGPGSGDPPPPRPARDTSIDCGDSCSSNNSNCEASPSCDFDGPSCNNSFSCDSTCSSSNSGGGCGGGCDGCSDDDGGGGGSCGGGDSSGGGGSCGGGDSGGGGSCGGGDSGGGGGGCGGGDSGGGGSCGGGDSSGGGGCGGSDSSGGGCGGGGGGGCSGGGGGCSGGGGGGSSGSCNTARRSSSPGALGIVSIAWACLPLPVALLIHRRARRRRASEATPTGCADDRNGGGEPGGSGDAPGDSAARGEEVTP